MTIKEELNTILDRKDAFDGLWVSVVLIVVISLLSYFPFCFFLRRMLHSIAGKWNESEWREAISRHRVIPTLATTCPMLLLSLGIRFLISQLNLAPDQDPVILNTLLVLLSLGFACTVALTIDRVIQSCHDLYKDSGSAMVRPIGGYVQAARISVAALTALFLATQFLDLPAARIFTGIGAVSALLALVFKNSLLAFSAGIQIASNDLVKVGDWIQSDELGVDGNVTDISLHVLKVQNWDKTIVSIPTQQLMETTFKNWRGMQQFGGRRFKRSILIDPRSVRISNEQLLQRIGGFHLLDSTIAEERKKMALENSEHSELTNLDFFQIYLEESLRKSVRVNKDGTLMVRQLDLTEQGGLPIEIYCFLNGVEWETHERSQSRIYSKFLASAAEFELDIFALDLTQADH